MKVFDRILMVIFSLLLIGISLITLFMALGWTIPLDYLNTVFSSLSNRWIIGITSIIILIGAINVVLANLMGRPVTQTKVGVSDYGEIRITLSAVEALVKKAASQIKGVREVKPVIKCTPPGISIFLRTSMLPGTEIPNAAQELQSTVKNFLEQTAGLNIVDINVLIHVFQDTKSRVD